MVGLAAHAWSLATAVVWWTCRLFVSAWSTVKTAVVAFAQPSREIQSERSVVRCRRGILLLVIVVVVVVFFGVATLVTKDDSLTQHHLTSRPLPPGVVQNKTPWVVVDGGWRPSFADSIASSEEAATKMEDGPREDDPVFVSRLGSTVGTLFGVARTAAGSVLKVWVGWGVVWSLVRLYGGSRSP